MDAFDLIVIGAGPGGYETAAEAAAKGMNVAVIERAELGGTCLNRGCIPTKALCRSAEVAMTVRDAAAFGVDAGECVISFARAVERKDGILAALREGVAGVLSGVAVIAGEAVIDGPGRVKVGDIVYTAPRIIIATGSAPAALPIPGAELAVTSDEVLSLDRLPASICIIGGGVIGMEFASIFNAFGVSVTVIEYCREILPAFDAEVAKRLRTEMKRRGVSVVTGAAVTAVREGYTVEYESKGRAASVEADMVLMAVGRRPVVPQGAEDAGIKVGRRGIEVDDTFATSVPGIYAIGDVNGRCMLAHAATAQGRVVLGEKVNLDVMPGCVFTAPECAMVGLTEEQCKTSGVTYKAVKKMFRANGKALAMGESEGLVKLIVDTGSRRILGCHILGPHAADLIEEAALAMSAGLTVDAIVATVHPHPTLCEVLQAAAAAC